MRQFLESRYTCMSIWASRKSGKIVTLGFLDFTASNILQNSYMEGCPLGLTKKELQGISHKQSDLSTR